MNREGENTDLFFVKCGSSRIERASKYLENKEKVKGKRKQ